MMSNVVTFAAIGTPFRSTISPLIGGYLMNLSLLLAPSLT